MESLAIQFQSSKEVNVSHFHSPVPLIAVPSFHNKQTEYKWMMMGSPSAMLQFPSSPVLFVHEAGLYHCQISCESKIVTASMIHVMLKAVDTIGTCL